MHKKSKFTLSISKRLFEFGFKSLERYLEEVDDSLKIKWQDFAEKTDKELKTLTEAESEEYIDIIYDDLAMVRDTLPQINGQTQILCIYAFMEHELIKLCKQYRRSNNIEMSVTDLKGGGLQASRAYLEKVARFKLVENEVWKRLNTFNKIRNVVAHYNGYLSPDYYHFKGIKKFISENPTLIEFKPHGEGAKASGEIVIKSPCVKQFREDVDCYFKEIYDCWRQASDWA